MSNPALGVSGPLYTADPTTGYDALDRLHELAIHYVPGGDVTLTSGYNRNRHRVGRAESSSSQRSARNWSDHRPIRTLRT